jgi:hypothetical protein
LRHKMHRLFNIQSLVAFSAEGIAGSILHEPAVLASHNFACFHADWNGCHGSVADRQSRLSVALFCTATGVTLGEMNHNCQVET